MQYHTASKRQGEYSNHGGLNLELEHLCAVLQVMGCVVPPVNSYVDTVTPNVTVFGDKAFKQVIKVK